jgi:aryl-alcohol dehydrogenase-like predicted oxidoreductase
METLELCGREMVVSRIAFGTEPLGGYEWGDVDPIEIERAIEMAFDHGVNLFDTADCYGHGESERRLGRILARKKGQAVIATKFGVRFDSENRAFYDNSVEYLEAALHGSLQRLGTDCIDLFQLHWPDGRTPLEAVFDRLDRLRTQGKIRAYGVTNVAPDALIAHAGRPGLASFSLQYSLAHREHEAAIQKVCDKGLVFLSWGSLGQGILSGRYAASHQWPENDRRRRAQYEHFHGEKLARNLTLVEQLREVARREGYASPAIGALRFILDKIPSSVAIVGVKSRAQIAQSAQAGLRPMASGNLRMLSDAPP